MKPEVRARDIIARHTVHTIGNPIIDVVAEAIGIVRGDVRGASGSRHFADLLRRAGVPADELVSTAPQLDDDD